MKKLLPAIAPLVPAYGVTQISQKSANFLLLYRAGLSSLLPSWTVGLTTTQVTVNRVGKVRKSKGRRRPGRGRQAVSGRTGNAVLLQGSQPARSRDQPFIKHARHLLPVSLFFLPEACLFYFKDPNCTFTSPLILCYLCFIIFFSVHLLRLRLSSLLQNKKHGWEGCTPLQDSFLLKEGAGT